MSTVHSPMNHPKAPSFGRQLIDFEALSKSIRSLARDGDLPARLMTEELDPSTRISELGLDSLGNLTLLDELEQMTGVEVPDNAIAPDSSLADIVTRINTIRQ
jgi:acyl carrier protein